MAEAAVTVPAETRQKARPTVVLPIVERIAEDAAFLWLWRSHQVRAPNVRLMTLSQRDEKLKAHLEALRIAGPSGAGEAAAQMQSLQPGAVFVAASLALATRQPEPLQQILDHAGLLAAEPEMTEATAELVAAVISAMAWGERDPAVTAIDRLRVASEPLLRAIAIAAIGARRSDPGPALASALADAIPVVRARAYRTTGQLGRADLMAHLAPGLTDPDPECRFWAAWAAARMGAGEEPLGVLAEIAWTDQPRAGLALDMLLRRLELSHANAWLREFAKLPGRQRDLIRATGVVGDPVYIPWLIERMVEAETARLAGEAFSMMTGVDLAYRDLDRKAPRDFQSGPNDDPADENVALDEDEYLPWPDPGLVGSWWIANLAHYQPGTPWFLGTPKPATGWMAALSVAFQRQRHAAAVELAIRMPRHAMFEVRARGRLQRQLLVRARGSS